MMGKRYEDISGQQFGEWTVLYPIRDANKRLMYHCRCSCGTERDISKTALIKGKTKSCGCKQGKNASLSKIKDISGQRFGRLVALKIAYRKPPKTYWLCQCDCGNSKIVDINQLTQGKIQSCGCYQRECRGQHNIHDLTGQRFGMLTVLNKTDRRTKTGNVIWLCKCDCGNEKEVAGTHLLDGTTSSCGCINSKGELRIRQVLDKIGIVYIQQFVFADCRIPQSNYPARFDFYLPQYNICIEYNGEQHYHYRSKGLFTLSEVEKIQERDNIKKNYCYTHNIPLIIIPYTDYKIIDCDYILERIRIE